MEISNTCELMKSGDHKDRFIAEYVQTKLRYEKLRKFNVKIEAYERFSPPAVYPEGFAQGAKAEAVPHNCPSLLLREQERAMGEYLHILEIRAHFEGIDLPDFFEKEIL